MLLNIKFAINQSEMVFVYILLSIIAVFSIMSFFSLRKLNRQTHLTSSLSDDRYYELKYKLQYLSSVGVVVLAICGFFGYDKYQNFTETLFSKSSELENKITKTDSVINTYGKSIKELDDYSRSVSGLVGMSKNDLRDLKKDIDNIKNKNVLDKSFYFVYDLVIPSSEKPKRFYFKDLETDIGDRLPVFNTEPTVLLAPTCSANFYILELNREYIDVGIASWTNKNPTGGDLEKFSFTLIISKKAVFVNP